VLNSCRIGFVNQHGRRFIVLERHYGCRDVMRWWFLKSSFIMIFNKLNSHMTDDCHIFFNRDDSILLGDRFILISVDIRTYYSRRTSINGHLSSQATFLVPADVPYVHSYFNLSAAATSPQRQRPPKCIPSAKETSRKWHINQRTTSGVYKTP